MMINESDFINQELKDIMVIDVDHIYFAFKGKHINVIAEDGHLILSLVDHESKESNIINLGKKEV